jgi:hypothetical protein
LRVERISGTRHLAAQTHGVSSCVVCAVVSSTLHAAKGHSSDNDGTEVLRSPVSGTRGLLERMAVVY